jgi:hypothetical protein
MWWPSLVRMVKAASPLWEGLVFTCWCEVVVITMRRQESDLLPEPRSRVVAPEASPGFHWYIRGNK